eukprot:204611-Prorocentrum_lima.AAC.1
MPVSRVPATLPLLGTLFEEYIHMLDLCMILGAIFKPRTALTVSRTPWRPLHQGMIFRRRQ